MKKTNTKTSRNKDTRTRVLIIGGLPPPVGGVETVVENMIGLDMEDYELIPFNTAKNKIIKSNILFNSINFIYRCIKLFFVIMIKNPKIIHIHFAAGKDFWQKTLFLLISKIMKRKTILHMHSGKFPDFYNASHQKNLIRKIVHLGDRVVVLTKGWETFYKEVLQCKNMHVLQNSIDVELINRYSTRHKPSKTTRMLFVGRIEAPKGIYELLFAMKKLKDADIHLSIMGPFMNNEKEIRTLCEKYGITDKVTFLGMILGDSRFKHFADSDIFVLPSYSEGLPLSILEAMAFGLPIIATDVGAISEVVKSKNGILIRPKDAEGLKKAIQKILDSPKRDEYMKNNIQVIKENYTKQIMKRDLTRIYESFN